MLLTVFGENDVPNYDFNLDLPISKKTDKQIADYLCTNQGMKYLASCNNSDYDLLMQEAAGNNITIETKEDFTCRKTGNIGLEYHCRGKPSGISVSKADYYYYKIHEPDGKISLYKLETSKLKDMVNNKLYHRIVNGGDEGSNSMNYLFRLEVVKQHFTFVCYFDN